jgi:hypothetical protein
MERRGFFFDLHQQRRPTTGFDIGQETVAPPSLFWVMLTVEGRE